jgi:hypothetical protein
MKSIPCLKRCMPSNDLSSLLMNSSSFSECGSLTSINELMYLDEDDSTHYKRQRTLSDTKVMRMMVTRSPATEALEAALNANAEDELFGFEFDFDPTSVLQVPGCGLDAAASAKSSNSVASVTCDFARMNTTASRSA